jgi:hypothetical protein
MLFIVFFNYFLIKNQPMKKLAILILCAGFIILPQLNAQESVPPVKGKASKKQSRAVEVQAANPGIGTVVSEERKENQRTATPTPGVVVPSSATKPQETKVPTANPQNNDTKKPSGASNQTVSTGVGNDRPANRKESQAAPVATAADYSELEKYIQDIVENKPNGAINWTEQFIEAKGQSVIDTERFKNNAQARAMATRGAIVVAQRNLLEMVQGVYVVGETTVQDMITTSDYIYTRVEGVVKGAVQVGPAIEKDGMIEVTMRIPIYGQKGVAGVFEESDLASARRRNGYREPSTNANLMPGAGEDIIDGSRPFVFSIKGKQIDPSMFPVVVDENGNIQFDFSTLYDTKTGKFPRYVQMSKRFMDDVGFQKGVDVIELVQNAKGEFTLSNNNKKRVFWQRLGNAAKGVGKFLFNLVV